MSDSANLYVSVCCDSIIIILMTYTYACIFGHSELFICDNSA